jgi:hypothetical protein
MKHFYLRSVPSCVTLSKDGSMGITCGWCPSKPAADAWCRQVGIPVSHGICETCYAKQLADIELTCP